MAVDAWMQRAPNHPLSDELGASMPGVGVPWVETKRAPWAERTARRAAPKERAMATIVMQLTLWGEMVWGWNGGAMDGRRQLGTWKVLGFLRGSRVAASPSCVSSVRRPGASPSSTSIPLSSSFAGCDRSDCVFTDVCCHCLTRFKARRTPTRPLPRPSRKFASAALRWTSDCRTS